MGNVMQDLTGKVAVVTGGSSGIGKGIAQRLKEAGATVVIASMNEARIAATAAELGVTGIQVDVTSAASVQALADSVIERFGKVDVIVNNAGVGSMGRVADLSLDDWKWMLDINLWGVIYGIHSFLPLLTANPDGGHVINVGSI
ncbi:MAG: SDR family NAD(P)-dependent oxidoreductase, partial [Actinobacteria bacterium]|nr:SDR family NAD(P)-dependent oxidoreductase [Actinomycetota bacterium]